MAKLPPFGAMVVILKGDAVIPKENSCHFDRDAVIPNVERDLNQMPQKLKMAKIPRPLRREQ